MIVSITKQPKIRMTNMATVTTATEDIMKDIDVDDKKDRREDTAL